MMMQTFVHSCIFQANAVEGRFTATRYITQPLCMAKQFEWICTP